MAKLGSEKRSAIIRVKTEARAVEIISICNDSGWQVIAGLEPDEPEDISDVEQLLNSRTPNKASQPRGTQ